MATAAASYCCFSLLPCNERTLFSTFNNGAICRFYTSRKPLRTAVVAHNQRQRPHNSQKEGVSIKKKNGTDYSFEYEDTSREGSAKTQSNAYKSFGTSKKEKKGFQYDVKEPQGDSGSLQDAAFLNAVVKVYCTHTAPDYSLPWQKQRQYTSTGSTRSSSYNISLISEAVQLLVPPARFEASKLNVVRLEDVLNIYPSVVPRAYILSHCDFTANLTLSISNVINLDQLRGWYSKDDVVAEWKRVNGVMCLHVHCFVSGPNFLSDLAAEFRYHIFSKELPLVLKAVLYGDSVLFEHNPGLTNSIVWVYFHSNSKRYNRLECWGRLKEAAEGIEEDKIFTYLAANREEGHLGKLRSPKSMIQTLFAFLL